VTTRVFLVGFMGVGKSTLGRQLAESLGWSFVDSDAAIEADQAASIVRIFQEVGEARFREIERRTIAALASSGDRTVVACGGGAYCDAESRTVMDRCGVTVWIDQPFDRIWRRRAELAGSRPLLRREAEARALYEQRVPIYALAALRVEVAEGAIEKALEDLLRSLRERFGIS
jgi:shikimate kinase